MEVAIKVVVVGNGAVGKSSMIQRYCKGIFTKDYKKTIGVDFLERQIQYVFVEYCFSVIVSFCGKNVLIMLFVQHICFSCCMFSAILKCILV